MKSLSVIIPTHNNATVIGRTLQSVLDSIGFFRAQAEAFRRVAAEVVIVDDGSTDQTPAIIEDWMHKKGVWNPTSWAKTVESPQAQGSRHLFCAKLVRREKSGGASCARNTGVARSSGDLLFFLDGDDLYFPPHLHACYQAAEEGKYFVKTEVHLADPVHADWKPAIEASVVINLCVPREFHFSFGGFPDFHLFAREGDRFRPVLDIFRQVEDAYYNQLLGSLFPGRRLQAETVQYFRYPGNAYDRQYEKFRRPRAENPESPSLDEFVRVQLGDLLTWYRAAQLRPDLRLLPPLIPRPRKKPGFLEKPGFCAATGLGASPAERSPDQRPDPGAFTADWFTHNIPLWEKLLSSQKGRPELRFLEIGSFEGRSACWLLENILTHPTSSLVCVDTFQGSAEHSRMDLATLFDRFQENIRPHAERVRLLKEPSQAALTRLHQEAARFDFIYIDGSHQAVDVLSDGVLSFALLKPGGLLIFDDYEYPLGRNAWEKPKLAIDAILPIYQPHYELLHKGYQVAIRKRS